MISAADQLAYKVRSVTKYLDRFHKIVLDGERIETFLAMESPIEDAQDAYTEQLDDGPLDVEFKNVSFSYPESDFSMKNISIRIKRGEKVAIVGEKAEAKQH